MDKKTTQSLPGPSSRSGRKSTGRRSGLGPGSYRSTQQQRNFITNFWKITNLNFIHSTQNYIKDRQFSVHYRMFTAQDISKNDSAHVLSDQQFQWQLQPDSRQTRKTCLDILKRGKKKTTGHNHVESETIVFVSPS